MTSDMIWTPSRALTSALRLRTMNSWPVGRKSRRSCTMTSYIACERKTLRTSVISRTMNGKKERIALAATLNAYVWTSVRNRYSVVDQPRSDSTRTKSWMYPRKPVSTAVEKLSAACESSAVSRAEAGGVEPDGMEIECLSYQYAGVLGSCFICHQTKVTFGFGRLKLRRSSSLA